jgi:hypothetical protein
MSLRGTKQSQTIVIATHSEQRHGYVYLCPTTYP